MILSIHQAEFLPWNGFFYKVYSSDALVIFDLAQYNKQDYQNRNKFDCFGKDKILTVPIKSHDSKTLMRDIKIHNVVNWGISIKNKLGAYYAPYEHYLIAEYLIESIWKTNWDRLVDLNVYLLKRLLEYLKIDTKIILSSELITDEMLLRKFNLMNTSDKNMFLCQLAKADVYISGEYGRTYLDIKKYSENNVKVKFINNKMASKTSYSIVDTVSKHGEDAKEIIQDFGELYE